MLRVSRFLSTPSARRATRVLLAAIRGTLISIHALCEEGDTPCAQSSSASRQFLSTPSARRATSDRRGVNPMEPISIHALCEEGDSFSPSLTLQVQGFLSTPSARRATQAGGCTPRASANFYPRPLRGGRLSRAATAPMRMIFLSTPSARRATSSPATNSAAPRISIHALCEEGDRRGRQKHRRRPHFYPRPLRGGRPGNFAPISIEVKFLSTPSARRATLGLWATDPDEGISIHALCEEGDLHSSLFPCCGGIFLSTPSARRATSYI